MNRLGIKGILALVMAAMLLISSAQAMSLVDAIGQLMQPEQSAAPVNIDEQNAEIPDPDGWWNILLMGCDSYSKNSYQRSDSMIIVSIHKESFQVKMTSLMRDTWVTVSGHKGGMKLTEACVYGGPEMTMRAINENFGMNISEYALVSLEGMADIIDLIGGIELDVTEAERKALNKGLFDLSSRSGMEQLEKSGKGVHLNGNQATAFARIRNIDSDFVRTERQRTVLMTMARKIIKESNGMELLGLVSVLVDYVDTNLSFTDIMTIAEVGLKSDLSAVEQLRLPADGTFDSGTFNGIWCIKPNFKKNAAILQDFIYG